MTYFHWLAIFFGIPLLLFILIDPKIFIDHKKIFFKILFGAFLIGFPADFIAINFGLWTFPKGLSGLNLFTIPLEEYIWVTGYVTIVVFLTLYLSKKLK
jgi:hypothetical protein